MECFHVTSWSHEEVHVILLVYRLIAESVLHSDTHANCTPDLSLIDLCCNVVTCYNYVRRKHSWLCSFWLPRRDGGHVQKCCGVMQNDVIFHHMIKTFCTHKWAADQNICYFWYIMESLCPGVCTFVLSFWMVIDWYKLQFVQMAAIFGVPADRSLYRKSETTQPVRLHLTYNM